MDLEKIHRSQTQHFDQSHHRQDLLVEGVERVSKSIQGASSSVDRAIGLLKGEGEQVDLAVINKQLSRLIQDQVAVGGKLVNKLEGVANKVAFLQDSTDQVKQEIVNQSESIRGKDESANIGSLYSELRQLNQGVLNELQGVFETFNGKLTEMLGQLGEDVLTKTSKDLRELNKRFTQETNKLLEQNLKAMNASFDLQRKESEASVQQHIAQFENVNKGLHTTREKLNQEVAAIESKFTSAIDRIADSLSGQSETLKATLGEKIKEVKTSFETGVELMAEAYNEKGEEIRSTYNQVESAIRGFNENIQDTVDETLRKNLEQLEATFKRLEELQSRSISNLSDTTKSFTEAVDKNQQISQEQSEILKQVKNQYQEIEELRTDMQALIGQWSAYSDKLHHLQDRVADLTNIIIELNTANSLLQKLNQNGHTAV